MKLPNIENAIIEEHKLTRYLLSESHPFGRGKASFLSASDLMPHPGKHSARRCWRMPASIPVRRRWPPHLVTSTSFTAG